MTLLTPPQNVYDQIERLVKKFKALSTRERNLYNEDNTRKDFILPLFRAFGWNIDDVREVAAEEKMSRGYVDFAFRINGVRRFVLETKRIGEDLNKPAWAQQAIDYAYHKGITWAVLSDFEGLKIFNAEMPEANPFQAQFRDFSIDDYLPRLDELWWLSREAMAEGVLDREAEKVFKKLPRVPIAKALFDNLVEWRKQLYRMLREYNRDKLWSSPKDIDDAVQRLLDRLIFTRTAEDRTMEDEHLIALANGDLQKLIPALKERFRELDAVYNSQLFRPDFVDTLEFGEPDTLRQILQGLDRSAMNVVRYNFALIDADVLGRVYEQYLGAVMSDESRRGAVITPTIGRHDAAPTQAPTKSKRKSQGIYYTPTFVVKHIVQQTLGRYLDEHGYNPAHPIRVLDPACGSGSFLIEAFEVLDRYLAHQSGDDRGEYGIRDHARQTQILSENIFGVDKDEQAVEVARLNLLLKALYLRKKLPTLKNIRCGDSLISGTDSELEKYFGAQWKERNPFDWHAEYDKVMAEGGFDVIVGNPPYVRAETLGQEFKAYTQAKFATFAGQADLYVYFIERAHQLLKPDGYFGMICSNKFMRSKYGTALREFLATKTTLVEIVDFGELPVFADAATFPVILITRNKPTKKQSFVFAPIKRLDFESLPSEVDTQGQQLNERALKDGNWMLTSSNEQAIIEKMQSVGVPLGDYVGTDIFFGIKTGINDAFVIDHATRAHLIAKDVKSKQLIKPFVVGDDVRKYQINFRDRYLILIPKGWTRSKSKDARDAWGWLEKNYPAIANHLKPFATAAEKRGDKGDYWWELRACDYYDEFEKPKIVYPDIAKESRIAFDRSGLYLANTIYFIPSEDLYLLAILNSKLIFAYYKRAASVLGDPDKGGRLRWFRQDVLKLPIRRINFDDPGEKKQRDAIAALVEEILGLQKDYAEADHRLHAEKAETLKRKIDAVDAKIDAAVYRLYDLTDEEIRVVQGKA